MLPLRHKPLIELGSTAVLLMTLVLVHEPILFAIGDFLVAKEDDLQPADMIHVLGGGLDRVDYAAELYHQGYAGRLFVSGCACSKYQERPVASGVRAEDLLPGSSCPTNTYEEALALKEFLEGDPSIQSVIIVSSPYHMRRARWSFHKVLDERVRLQFAPVPFEMAPYEQRWWTTGWSRKLVLKEYLGILFYYVRYQFIC